MLEQLRELAGLSIEEIEARLRTLPENERLEIIRAANEATRDMRWVPNPGPQTRAYDCDVDQLLYGGQAGGGKSDLLVGKALQKHRRSLLLRRIRADASWLIDRTAEILGTRDGFNGQDNRWTLPDGRVIDFDGCQHPGDEQRFKGRPKDFIGFDEAADFLEDQVVFILGWLRTTDPEQPCQAIFATNPPTTAEGEWIVRWFGPWVDDTHPLYPYPEGKPLWVCRGEDDDWLWFEAPGDQVVGGRTVQTISRTFIRSTLADNPDLWRSDYRKRLEGLPEHLRLRFAEGAFGLGTDDDDKQLIPTDWIKAAQDRWTPRPPEGTLMTAMGVDMVYGGKDELVLAPRYGRWCGELIVRPGVKVTDGREAAAIIVQHLRDAAQINIDHVGWGASGYERLQDLGLCVLGLNGGARSDAKSRGTGIPFANLRAEMWYRMREALDPANDSPIALPPDPNLRADLAAPRFDVVTGKIRVESKDQIRTRLGRSPDRGDAVVMAFYAGERRAKIKPRRGEKPRCRPAEANLGYEKFKSRNRRRRYVRA